MFYLMFFQYVPDTWAISVLYVLENNLNFCS